MEPDVLFHRCVFHWFRKLAQMCGIDLFLSNYKPTAYTRTVVSTFYILMFSCLWTIYSYEFDEKCICAPMLAFDIQGIIKFHSILSNRREMKDLCDFSLKIYRANTKSSQNKTFLEKSVKLTVFIFKYGICLLIATAVLVSMKPYISYILFGKVEPILPTYFPGINEQKAAGYAALAVFHIYLLAIFVVGTAGADLALMTFVVHCQTMSKIFKNAVNEFDRLVKNNKPNTPNKDIHASLRNLILMHIDFIKYTKILKMTYNNMCLVQISMSNVIMTVLMYVILMTSYFPAYFLMVTAFFQVFEYSVLGTIVEISNDNMYDAVCTIPVTDLPTKEQKKVILMILNAQNPHNLSIGGFDVLNVETFVYSMKTTYSVGMLLINAQA